MNTKSQSLKSLLNKVDRKDKLKVCIISLIDLKVDGRSQRQIKTLRQAGYDVSIIYHQKTTQGSNDVDKDINIIGVKVWSRILPKFFLSYMIMYLEFCLKATFYAMREKADIYQAVNLDTLIIAYVLFLLRKTPLVYDSREIYTDMQGVKMSFLWQKLESVLLKKVDAVIDVNLERARFKQDRYALTQSPFVVMNCPEIITLSCHDGKALHAKLATLGLSHKKVVIYQGAIMRGRYLDNLVRAMKHVRSDAVLILMGPDHRYCDELKTLVGNLDIAKKVLFFDLIPPAEIVSFVYGADIGILFYEKTSLNNYYCAPTKLYEYLMAGLPILVNDLPHLKTMAIDERVGKLLHEVSPESISYGIDEMLESSAEIKTMSKRAREIACERYNWATQAKIYVRIIRGLVNASAL